MEKPLSWLQQTGVSLKRIISITVFVARLREANWTLESFLYYKGSPDYFRLCEIQPFSTTD